MFSLSIFIVNFGQAKPLPSLDQVYSEFRRAEVKQVPVIRIFGTTPEGQKTCLHVHNVFPYLYIKPPRSALESNLGQFAYDLANNIDRTLNSYVCNKDINCHQVYKIEPVNTKSMYGYHEKDSCYLKIYLYNPELIKTLSELLLQGTIMNESFQTYESHVPFNLQFLMDYNLFGMNSIELDKVKFRRLNKKAIDEQGADQQVASQPQRLKLGSTKWDLSEMDPSMFLEESAERQSTCELEVDALAEDILNPKKNQDGFMLNPGLSAIWSEEDKRRKELEIKVPLQAADEPERPNVKVMSNEIELKQKLISLLELRFGAKYPFKPEKSNDQSGQEASGSNETLLEDQDILDILNDLHNNSDLDNSQLQTSICQLNESGNNDPSMGEDNDDLTQILHRPDSERDKLDQSIERENDKYLNEDSSESESSDEEKETSSIAKSQRSRSPQSDTSRDDVRQEIMSKSQLNLIDQSCISTSSDEEADIPAQGNLSKDSSIPGTQANKPAEHDCSYFGSSNPACGHLDTESKLKQSVCLSCEFTQEFKDSLDHMAFHSPVPSQNASIKDKLNELKFNSPTASSNLVVEPVSSSLELNEIEQRPDEITLPEQPSSLSTLPEETPSGSLEDQSESMIKSQEPSSVFSESTLMWSDSDNDQDESEVNEYKLSREMRLESKRKQMIEQKLISARTPKEKRNVKPAPLLRACRPNKHESWYSPYLMPPLPSELTSKASSEPLVSYYKKNSKFKLKLHLEQFESKIKSEPVKLFIEPDNTLKWFTPAITLPSVNRIQKKMKSKAKLISERKESKIKQINKMLGSQRSKSTESTQSVLLPAPESSISIVKISKTDSKKAKKTVRFHEKVELINQDNSACVVTEKGHHTIVPVKCDMTFSQVSEISTRRSTQFENRLADVSCDTTLIENNEFDLNSTNTRGLKSRHDYAEPASQLSLSISKKTVRFSERLELVNEINPSETEKGHHTVEKITSNMSIGQTSQASYSILKSSLKRKHSNESEAPSIGSSLSNVSIIKYENQTSVSSSHTDSNDTLMLDEPLDETMNQTISHTNNQSIFEYDSILFPKAAKLVDYLSMTSVNDMSTVMEYDEDNSLPAQKETKKDKKIISAKSNLVNNSTSFLTIMSLELHVNTRANLTPNSDYDSIGFICYTIYYHKPPVEPPNLIETNMIVFDREKRSMETTRYLTINSNMDLRRRVNKVSIVYSEEDMLNEFIKAVQFYDPDILVGYEIQKHSWGYLIKRAMKLNIADFCLKLSRLPKSKRDSMLRLSLPKDARNKQPTSGTTEATSIGRIVPNDVCIGGRVVLNLWRVLRGEISLGIYTLENCCYQILNERVPKYNYSTLTSWFVHKSDLFRWKTIDYYLYRSRANIRIMNSLDLIDKTSEFARVYGIEFYHVLSRGSQYRVESMMLRIARKLNYIAFSASQKQKAQMRASECIPLTLEPESKFYTDPMAVLDFQSLYPSVIIAYNICFTTCLGRVDSIKEGGCFKFGCGSLFLPDSLLKSLNLERDIYIAPNGVAFVRTHIRKGVLPIMLEDILATRFMVKHSMKLHKQDANLLKILESRQMGLKLIANVTFGYTAANFSGRMPCMEIGDSIVRVARQTLENSIKYIQNEYSRAGCRVVYGDTDSLFVLFERLKKKEAFDISAKIVDEITDMNPIPVKLKFEKVYLPSILLAQKRYIGNMYETLDQAESVLDAKGVEIVRRDGCQIAAKVLERSCKILFEFKDVAKCRDYLVRQVDKLVNGKINLKELIIAKEYRGRSTYSNPQSVAACQVANKALAKDPLAEPLNGERVPYVIVYGTPGQVLYELVRSPTDLIENHDLKPNYEYYALKQMLPPLHRIFLLMNVNVFEWVRSVSFKPRVFYYLNNEASSNTTGASHSIQNFVYSTNCVLCGKKRDMVLGGRNKQGLCGKCGSLNQDSVHKLLRRLNRNERRVEGLMKICRLCTMSNQKSVCVSLDCPNTFLNINAQQESKKTDYIRKVIDQYF